MRSFPAFALVALIGVAACSTEGKVTPLTSSVAAPLPAASVWSLTVKGCERLNNCEELRSAIAGRLVGASLAERIVVAGQTAQLSLTVDVNRVRTVSGTERVLFGVLAGRNEVAGLVTLQDLRASSPGTLRSFRVEAGSASHPFSGESGVQDAYREFASDVVSGLRA